jgi:hypothetical protein
MDGGDTHTTSHNGIDNPSLLYTTADDLLTSSLLTPESEPKFDLGPKVDDGQFGDFHHTIGDGIFDQYNDSGPSSIQFGDGMEQSEHEDGHLSAKDDVGDLASRSNDWHARTNRAMHSGLAGANYGASTYEYQNGAHEFLNAQRSNLQNSTISMESMVSPSLPHMVSYTQNQTPRYYFPEVHSDNLT